MSALLYDKILAHQKLSLSWESPSSQQAELGTVTSTALVQFLVRELKSHKFKKKQKTTGLQKQASPRGKTHWPSNKGGVPLSSPQTEGGDRRAAPGRKERTTERRGLSSNCSRIGAVPGTAMLPPTSNLDEPQRGRALCYTAGNTGAPGTLAREAPSKRANPSHAFACDHTELTLLFHPDPPGQTCEERAKGKQ